MEIKIKNTNVKYSEDGESAEYVAVSFESPFLDGQSLNGTIKLTPEEFSLDTKKTKLAIKSKLAKELSK